MVGLLLDSLSQNTGDQAIFEVMLGFLKKEQRTFDVLSPLGFDARPYQPIVVGGGHILRDRGDWFYDVFRVPGRHILNVAGVSTTDDLGYLADYAYVSVRSQADWRRVSPAAPRVVVCPCVSLTLQPDQASAIAAQGSIGFHFHEQSWAACGDEKLFVEFREYPQVLLPVTHYNGDYWLLKNLSARLPVKHDLLPRLPPRAVLREIGRMRALVCSSLHAAIFAYSRNVPFLAFGYPDKIVEFMEDRGLQQWIFRDRDELRSKLALLLDKPPDYSASLAGDLKRLGEHFKCLSDCLPKVSNAADRSGSEQPSIEHKLIVEHHNRLAVLERMADRLLTTSERIESDAARQDSRVDHLRKLVEEPTRPAPEMNVDSQALSNLPFGVVEFPGPGQIILDDCQVSGWALCPTGISEIDVYVDSGFVGAATYGEPRPDVGRAYPGLPDGHHSGWKITLHAGRLTTAEHELLIQARSRAGLTRDLASFSITVASPDELPASSIETQAVASPQQLQPDQSRIIADSLDSLTQRIAQAEDGKRDLDNAIQGLANQVLGLQNSIHNIQALFEGTLGAIRNEIEGLKTISESNRARAGATETEISTLKPRLASLAATTDSLWKTAFSLDERTGRTEASVTQSLGENLTEIRELTAGVARLEQRVHSNTLQIRSIFQSRIWKTLRTLASLLYRFTPNRGRGNQTSGRLSRSKTDESFDAEGRFEAGGETETLRIGIDSHLPATLTVGKGNVICVSGWCYHPRHRIARLEIVSDGIRYPVKVHGNVRADVFAVHHPQLDPHGYSFRSGFWGLVGFPGRSTAETVNLYLHATLENGEEWRSGIGSTILSASSPSMPLPPANDSLTPGLVVICLTTYNPPLDLFSRQIESLIQQSYQNWICIISDDCSRPETYQKISALVASDRRFRLHQTPERLGFYRNFEYCLSLVPSGADFVTLCDHDDYWHPDKLEALLLAFGPDTALAYSDMRIVDEQGRLLFNTYWTTRKNNYKNLTSLLIANTVTGAASMFRRRLLDVVLPFPQTPGEPYHDHWIACAALATGTISYVDRPLYDYVQHSGNVIGHYVKSKDSILRTIWAIFTDRAAFNRTLALWRDIYFGDVLRIEMLSDIIQLRVSSVARGKQRAIRRLSGMDQSVTTGIWLGVRRMRELWRGNETLAAETRLLRGILWKYSSALRSRFGPSPQLRRIPAVAPAGTPPGTTMFKAALEVPDSVALIRQKIAPLTLEISDNSNWRVNLLIPTIDFDYVFGGYIAKFNLAQRLADRGFRVRLVIVDYCDYKPELWKQQVRQFDGMSRVLDCCELTCAFDRRQPLEVTPNDCFIATTWWTAHIAREAGRELGKRNFLYLIQEYEPFTFPMGTFASLARETYDWPHYALFSTEFLRDYFRQERLGVFAEGISDGERRSAVFRNAITKVDPPTLQAMQSRNKRKLLFYARPESHAARNMFELGILALCEAIEAGIFDDRWEFTGIGSVAASSSLNLTRGRQMQLLRRQDQGSYKNVLMEHDLGLSLMYTPHPSLVPIEMASSGMVVVTNTFANKTDERLLSISPNFIGVGPTVKDIVAGLKMAVSKVEQFDFRVAGAKVNWCRDWNEAFDDSVMERAEDFLADIRLERGESMADAHSRPESTTGTPA